MVKLTVIKINTEYETALLENIVQEATKPFGTFFDYSVQDEIEEIDFQPPIDTDYIIPEWLLFAMNNFVEHFHPEGKIFAFMPYGIYYYDENSGAVAVGRVTFLSTNTSGLDTNNPSNFLSRGTKAMMHELGHREPFNLDHHTEETWSEDNEGYCPLYVANKNVVQSLDKMGTKFCRNCNDKIAERSQLIY